MRHTRVLAAAAAALIAAGTVSGVAVASGSSDPKTPAASAEAKRAAGKEDGFAKLAAKYGLTAEQLEQALINVKRAIGPKGAEPTEARIAELVARELGLSPNRAERLVRDLFGQQKPGAPKDDGKEEGKQVSSAAFIRALAEELGISRDRAKAVYTELDRLSRLPGKVDGHPAEFAALARSIGITPEALGEAIYAVKSSLAGDPDSGKKPAPSGEKPASSGTDPSPSGKS